MTRRFTDDEVSRDPLAGCVSTLRELKRAHVIYVYQETGQNMCRAARLLGIGRSSLFRLLRGYGALRSQAGEVGDQNGS
jgi:transcriptional regulator of acetoin/glycerol metabolism